VVLHTKMDTDALHGKTIMNLKEELLGKEKYIIALRSDQSRMQAQLALALKDAEAKIRALEGEVQANRDALRSEQTAHARHKTEWADTEAALERELAATHKSLEARTNQLESTEQALEEEQCRAIADQQAAAAELQDMIEQRDELQQESQMMMANYKQQVAGLMQDVSSERQATQRAKKLADDTQLALDLEKESSAKMKSELEEEVRRCNGSYLRAKGDVKDAQALMATEIRGFEEKLSAAQATEKELRGELEMAQREAAKAMEAKRIAEARLEKESLKRATAIVESQAERSLREATETSKVFDSVRYDVAYDQQERNDLDRVLDAATYQLSEVSYTNQAILQSSYRLGKQLDAVEY